MIIRLNHSSKNHFSLFDKNSTPTNFIEFLRTLSLKITLLTLVLITSSWMKTNAFARPLITSIQQDTIPTGDTLRYPIQDRRGDKFSIRTRNPFDLKDPANISDSITYDPKTKEYYIIEKIGSSYFRKPISLSFDEFMRLQARRSEREYFQKRANTSSLINRKLVKPKMNMGEDLFNRLFGTGKIDIKPQGEVNITAGYQGQNIKNPTLPERARRNGGLDFDMAANLNVLGNIGDKMKFPISYNTLSTFDFENQLKLDYTGGAEDIFKKIEVGNTTFASNSEQTIDTFPVSSYRSAKYLVQVSDNVSNYYHVTELLLIWNASTVQKVEYAVVTTAGELGTFDADINSGNVRLLFTASDTLSRTIKYHRTLINS